MGHRNEGALSRADGVGLPVVDGDDVYLWHFRIFLLALLDHHRRKVLGVDRRIAEARHEEGNAADVVEVSVGNKDCAHAVSIRLKIAGVREHVIDARVITLGHELEACVADKDVIAGFNRKHVASDFFHAS